MRIKTLAIFGFKTFPEPTEIHLHEGINAIVGPNGCGKSNIIDAIRWVMGETSAKGLRGDSMEDVIFSGTDSRKSMNVGEVTLTLTQVEGRLPERFGNFHEIAVTRRLHRSGESEYLINRVPCRLKDITELFMDTGVGRRAYSVVEQGRIDAILSAKPQDRRVLIEEAAGITKYKSRKEEASRKMEETAQNLARLGDIIGEVRREMNVLRRQAARAEEFKALRSERRSLERHLLVSAWLALDARRRNARETETALTARAVESRVLADRTGATLEGSRLALLEQERDLERRQRQIYHTRAEIAQRESRVDFLRRETTGLEERSLAARQEGEELKAREATLGAETEALAGELMEADRRLEDATLRERELAGTHAEALARLAEAQKSVERQKAAHLRTLGDLTRANHALDHSRRQEEDGRRRLEGMGRQEADVVAKLREIEEELKIKEEGLAAAEQARERAVEERARADARLKEARSRRQALSVEAERARKEVHTDQSRLKGLEQIKENLEGYGAGVRAILREAKEKQRDDVRGVVADVISAPTEYESALEAALGERLQYVIVESSARGAEAVKYLKSQRAGRSSFAPLNMKRGTAPVFPDTAEVGARGRLLDLVQVSAAYQQLAECLLGDVFVIDTIEDALRLWQKNGFRATFVTLEGEALSPEGVITGGAGKQEGGGLLRKNREIRELSARVEKGRHELERLEAALLDLDGELEDLHEGFEASREDVHRRELEAAHVGRDLGQLKERRERLEERREAMEFEREDLTSQIRQLNAETSRLEEERARLLEVQEEVDRSLETLQADADEAGTRVQATQSHVTELRIEVATDRQRREGLSERIRTLRSSRENVSRRMEKLEKDVREAQTLREERARESSGIEREREVLLRELEVGEKDLSCRAQALDGLRGELTEEERSAAQARRDADESHRQLGEAQMAVKDLELRAENLRERFGERQQSDIEVEATAGLPDDFDTASAETRIRELDGHISSFGEINLLAIEEYAEKKSRHGFLEAQRKDLEESLESLRQAIQRINRVSRERFAETFEKVTQMFQDVYPKMFRGGEARLVLTDPDNLLESGIEIIARPPGKKPQHISLLSGGEKALTAAALIFSIFLVKPSPFCILDEVDAPLDEANIGRFTDMVRTMSSSSQFLVITHNKSTMEAADHLYGITMSEPGVSKVVSVRLGDERPARAA